MNTPIYDFVKNYADKKGIRFHMPGHKGIHFLGCEAFDITEVCGADALYEADGIIAESEENASRLFGTKKTLFSTEGSSQCIRAMLCLVAQLWKKQNSISANTRPYILATRNVHKAFVYAAALIDFDVVWLYPEEMHSLCSCHISPDQLEAELKTQLLLRKTPPAAVYVTSPDYLGGLLDIGTLSFLCHKYNTYLAVDNAHGAYLHFLEQPIHPMDLGADICCDSAHKTLPVLTGGAYLQISQTAPSDFAKNAKQAMALFGSTSPSYLTLASLDLCNAYLTDDYREKLKKTTATLEKLRSILRDNGWDIEKTDPLKLTIHLSSHTDPSDKDTTFEQHSAFYKLTGYELAKRLRQFNIECEYADFEYVVLMATPENTMDDYERLLAALAALKRENNSNEEQPDTSATDKPASFKPAKCLQKCSIREAVFGNHERLPVSKCLGKICGNPTVGCPPAIPIVISGECIDENAMTLLQYYGITHIEVVTNDL